MRIQRPEILAPAGDRQSFLAGVAAGADAVYLGLKHFSARMQAKNFGLGELAALTEYAHDRGVRVHVAVNVLLKPGDDRAAGSLIAQLARVVHPDALIVQDLGIIPLARQAGFEGELHISTLANATHPAALNIARDLGANRVVIPRELNLDEVRQMAVACPEGLDLEIFVHGALCHCVSGRCWWSSFLGGKSGLRGRCVQPCRRLYREGGPKGKPERLFSCQDLSLDVLTKPLLEIPQVGAWKIEGRKKGPHYVYYVVTAYRLLRDDPASAETRRTALSLIEQALGRPGTHGVFLPQRPFPPVRPEQETASGALVGQIGHEPGGRAFIRPREELLAGDLLRVGCEDDPWHQTIPLRRSVPKGGRLDIRPAVRPSGGAPHEGARHGDIPRGGGRQGRERAGRGFRAGPPSKAPVFLIDRREPELARILADMERELKTVPEPPEREPSNFRPPAFVPARVTKRLDMEVRRALPKGLSSKGGGRRGGHGPEPAVWLERSSLLDVARPVTHRVWWWLPPVIWPSEEERYAGVVAEARARGAAKFVLNAPWQIGLFPDRDDGLEFVGGPFCNLANAHAAAQFQRLGMSAAFVSPELSGAELMELPRESPIPLGIVVGGLWPLGITRIPAPEVRLEEPILSPHGEVAFVRKFGGNHWIFPGWELDLSAHRHELEQAGYAFFATLNENWPRMIEGRRRTSVFNWDQGLL